MKACSSHRSLVMALDSSHLPGIVVRTASCNANPSLCTDLMFVRVAPALAMAPRNSGFCLFGWNDGI